MKIIVTLIVFYLTWASASASFAQETCGDMCALVVGNAEYDPEYRLINPVRDAESIATGLRAGVEPTGAGGFDVTLVRNASLGQLRESLNTFAKSLRPNSVALFFYAGHAVQQDGVNFLLPVNIPFEEAKALIHSGTHDAMRAWLKQVALPLDELMAILDGSGAMLRIVLLDACRDDPLRGRSRSLGQTGGLAKPRALPGTILSYATQPDNVALDGTGVNSPYTSALSQRLWTPGVTIGDMLNLVGNDVLNATDGFQQPWVSSSPIPIVCLAGCNTATGEAALSQLAVSVAGTLRARDLRGLQLLVPLPSEQRARWQALFDQYAELRISVGSPVIGADRDRASVSLRIESVQSSLGQDVIPSDAWGALTLEGRWQREAWRVTGLRSDYLEGAAGSIDYLAPEISKEALTIHRKGAELIEVVTSLKDDSEIESAALYYRDANVGGGYKSVPLEQIGNRGRFRSTLFTRHINSDAIDVYVETVDTIGNRTRHPPATQPVRIALSQIAKETSTASVGRRWLWAAGAALVLGILVASDSEGSTGDTRPVHITTPLP